MYTSVYIFSDDIDKWWGADMPVKTHIISSKYWDISVKIMWEMCFYNPTAKYLIILDTDNYHIKVPGRVDIRPVTSKHPYVNKIKITRNMLEAKTYLIGRLVFPDKVYKFDSYTQCTVKQGSCVNFNIFCSECDRVCVVKNIKGNWVCPLYELNGHNIKQQVIEVVPKEIPTITSYNTPFIITQQDLIKYHDKKAITKVILNKIEFADANVLKKLLNIIYQDSSGHHLLINQSFTSNIIALSDIPSDRNMLEVIPTDLMGYLLNFLDVKTVERFRALNKQWKETIDNPQICKFRKHIQLNIIHDYSYHLKDEIINEVLEILGNKYNRVNKLFIGDTCFRLTIKGLISFTKNCPNLTHLTVTNRLNIVYYDKLNIVQLTKLFSNCKKLKKIWLQQPNIGSRGHLIISKMCKHLVEYLNYEWRYIGEDIKQQFYKNLPDCKIGIGDISSETGKKKYIN